MKKTLLSIFLTIITLISFSQIRISGYVIDVFSKAPLEKAIVTLNGSDNTLITDKEGFFTVVLKQSGVYDFQVSKNGYKSLSESLMLNESLSLEIMLTSNAGTESPAYSSKTVAKEEKKYLAKDEYTKTKKAREEKLAREKEEQAKLLAETKKAEENRLAKLLAEEKALEEKILTTKDKEKSNKRISSTSTITNNTNKDLLTLSGTIRDKYTKAELRRAVISFDKMKKTYTTTANGLFKFKIPKGTYKMTVKMSGYKTETAEIPVSSNLDITILLTKKVIKEFTTDVVVISGTRVTNRTPTTFTKIKREELLENSLGKDLPYLLELSPSVVASSDGGNGTGYTSMRIRGSDMSSINFTLNGFPVNDAESQGVFLVDLPDLSADIEDIQIQRGIGTSTNGAGAFGASVNINTNKKNEDAYAAFYNSYGSFNTLKNTIKAGTGLLYKHFTVDGRFSHLMTDGYIDRATAKMYAYSLNAAYYNKTSSIRFNIFSGKEKTYQAWNGIGYSKLQNDRTYNSSGTDYGQKAIPYDNEVDNYNQTNYQLSFTHKFFNKLTANLGFHYTKGKGYFEQYKVSEDLLDYGIINSTSNTDLVRRRWLDNDFFGSIFSLGYKAKNIKATLGGAWNQYDGDHYGEIIWAKDAKDVDINEYYYSNNGLKTDFNVFVKGEFTVFKRLVLFGDVQYRNIGYSIDGVDNDERKLFEDVDYNFVNPKVGLTVLLGEKKRSQIYTSFAMANKEPNRNDFIDNTAEPKPENMMDFELGFRHKNDKLRLGANAFYMKYKNQLVLTGELNDVGSAVRTNVDNSFRTGVELEFAYEPLKFFGVNAAGTWSLNEIEEFTFTDYLGNTTTHDKTKIAYAPTLVGNIVLYTKPFKGFKFSLINKYVSEQYLDNTNSKSKILTPYFLMDARVSYSIKPKFMNEIELILKANNLFNTKYSTNGYVYYDTPYFYPQAGTNFEGGVNLKF